MSTTHSAKIFAGGVRIDSIVSSFRILRRIREPDTIELLLRAKESSAYIAGASISIELRSDGDIYAESFSLTHFDKDGDTLTIYAVSSLAVGQKGGSYALAESSRAVAERLGANINTRLTDFPLSFAVENKSRYDALIELSSITGAEVYEEGGVLVIADMAVIDDTPEVVELHEKRDIMSASVSVAAPTVREVYVNIADDETIYAEPSLILAIDYDPHPITPLSPIVYTRDTQTYTISPARGRAIVYASPLGSDPVISSQFCFTKRADYAIVERFTLDSDHSVTLAAGVKSIIAIELDDTPMTEYACEIGYNKIAWDEPKSGELKISYNSDIWYAHTPPSLAPKKIPIKATHEGLALSYTYIYDYTNYYPLPMTKTISLITDFNLESEDAVNATVTIQKGGVAVQSVTADAFGELEATFTAYGVYALVAAGATRWITLFANEYMMSADKPEEAIC